MISVRYNPMRVINSTGIVMIILVLKVCAPEILKSLCVKTCNHSNVAKEPIGVVWTKSEPITFA